MTEDVDRRIRDVLLDAGWPPELLAMTASILSGDVTIHETVYAPEGFLGISEDDE